MSLFNIIPLAGVQPTIPEQTTAQFVIPAGAGATFAVTNNIATITFNAAHGLTMNPTAPALPNYFISFGGSTSGLTGTGILVGNIFRILTIPSTTTITIYTTITAATVTSMTGIPVFFPSFALGPLVPGDAPTQTISSVVTPFPNPVLGGCEFNITTGANIVVQYNPDATAIALDSGTGVTPGTAPTWRTLVAASSQGQIEGAYPYIGLFASGTTATSRISVIR